MIRMFQKDKKLFRVSVILFLAYTIIMLWEIFIGPYRSHDRAFRYNLYPFTTIFGYLANYNKVSFEMLFINLAGNIVTFVPLGFFMPILFYNRVKSYKEIILVSSALILTVEILQLLLRVGVFDVDDIILNTFGCVCGYWIYTKMSMLKLRYG